VTAAVPYTAMDSVNYAPDYAAARCQTCGAYNDLHLVGSIFTCRGIHPFDGFEAVVRFDK